MAENMDASVPQVSDAAGVLTASITADIQQWGAGHSSGAMYSVWCKHSSNMKLVAICNLEIMVGRHSSRYHGNH